MELVTFKLDKSFLKDVDKVSKEAGYHSRTEFIRNALREKVEEAKLKQAMILVSKMRGASKKKTTDEELHRIRETAFEEISKRFK